jgi:FtsP/CotA-like multicopper oxidase with cupredoxin domain
MKKTLQVLLTMMLTFLAAGLASAQGLPPAQGGGPLSPTAQGGGSFMVQCPKSTLWHPAPFYTDPSRGEPAYSGPAPVNPVAVGKNVVFDGRDTEHPVYMGNGGQIKCQEISGGDGYMTEADGNQTFMFSFGPLSGLDNIKNGKPGTLLNTDFNGVYCVDGTGAPMACTYSASDIQKLGYYNSMLLPSVCNSASMSATCATAGSAGIVVGGAITDPTYDPARPENHNAGIADPATIMTIGVMNGNIPAPLIAFDEDDEFFLTLSNVGMIMRPDLFEQHTVHFHGYPNASSYYDGVPDATWAINIGGSATYYYLAPDAGTYFWHCHITPPEHLQMGMVGQLYVRPRQNRVPASCAGLGASCTTSLYTALAGGQYGPMAAGTTGQQDDLRTACQGTGPSPNGPIDLLCSVPLPAPNSAVQVVDPYAGIDPRIPAGTLQKYAYNDGDGSTAYQIDVPIQIHGFDPNFHFVGMTFNPEGFADMKDKYFLLNGRSYPDTVGLPTGSVTGWTGGVDPGAASTAGNPDAATNAIGTEDSDGRTRYSQPLPTLITLKRGEKALLRIADLDVTEYQTLASLGIPMQLVGFQAKILRDQAGNNMYVTTNSVTLGGGESLDVILDSGPVPPGTYFLYTPNLDHLSNDAENFGGLMTEVVVTP